MDPLLLLKDVLILAAVAAAIAVILLPVVFIIGFVYQRLLEKHPGKPAVLFIYICTFLGSFVVGLLAYIYILLSVGLRPFA